jgi:hypothetical protein
MTMLPNIDDNMNPRIWSKALAWWQSGCSILPLDAVHAKKAAVPWKDYITRKATLAEIERWFGDNNPKNHGLAIVTGQVSDNLVVLDLDDRSLIFPLIQRFPFLLQTSTIMSALRQAPHYYLRVAQEKNINSRKFKGIDVKAEGGYVVTAPTTIDGKQYTVVNDAPILTISAEQWQEIIVYLEKHHASPKKINSKKQAKNNEQGRAVAKKHTLSEQFIISEYVHKIVTTGSRNEALFQVACLLRDRNYPQQFVIDTLAHCHAEQRPDDWHPDETYAQRYKEALRTIASVYSRPPRSPEMEAYEAGETNLSFLDNRVREKLLQDNIHLGAAILRVYEGLIILGMSSCDRFTFNEAYCLLQPLGIGKRAIFQALDQSDANKWQLFKPIPSPSLETPSPGEAESHNIALHAKQNALLERQSETNYKETGKKAQYYRFPSQKELYKWLNIEHPVCGDPIAAKDLQSPRIYRQALQREFIRRRPGVHANGYLGYRLGVSVRTLQRYNTDIPINSLPTFVDYGQIVYETLDLLPETGENGGFFLQDQYKNRYPARESTARWLLGQGKKIFLRAQGYNYYWYGELDPAMVEQARLPVDKRFVQHWQYEDEDIRRHILRAELENRRDNLVHEYWQQVYADSAAFCHKDNGKDDGAIHQENEKQAEIIPPKAPVEEKPKPETPKQRMKRIQKEMRHRERLRTPKSDTHYKRPLSDPSLESLAQKMHEKLNQPFQHGEQEIVNKKMRLVDARRLIDTFGLKSMYAAYKQTLWARDRGKLRNPVGFLIMQARAEWRKRHPDVRSDFVPVWVLPKRRKSRAARQGR